MTTHQADPSTLLAILIAARRSGDHELERHARKTLQDQHGITMRFKGQARRSQVTKEADHAC
jgi:hypothetical protein